MGIFAVAAVGCVLWGGAVERAGPSLADLAFLEGAWEWSEGDSFAREVWDPARGGSIVGHFSMGGEGKTTLYELLVIEQDGDAVVLRLRHFGRGLEPWASEASGPLTMPLLEIGENRAVFEDPGRPFPRRMVYASEGDRLTVRLEPAEGVEREPIVLEFSRAGSEEGE